jgi:hypothetical protein
MAIGYAKKKRQFGPGKLGWHGERNWVLATPARKASAVLEFNLTGAHLRTNLPSPLLSSPQRRELSLALFPPERRHSHTTTYCTSPSNHEIRALSIHVRNPCFNASRQVCDLCAGSSRSAIQASDSHLDLSFTSSPSLDRPTDRPTDCSPIWGSCPEYDPQLLTLFI